MLRVGGCLGCWIDWDVYLLKVGDGGANDCDWVSAKISRIWAFYWLTASISFSISANLCKTIWYSACILVMNCCLFFSVSPRSIALIISDTAPVCKPIEWIYWAMLSYWDKIWIVCEMLWLSGRLKSLTDDWVTEDCTAFRLGGGGIGYVNRLICWWEPGKRPWLEGMEITVLDGGDIRTCGNWEF